MLNKKIVRTQDIAFKKAFTLIELLVVIAIIGILATLAVVALQQARQNARDSKRMADVKQIHTALELFFNENGRYPTTEEWNSGSIVSSTSQETFMYSIPSAPTPADGSCLEASNSYAYIPSTNGDTYTIDFCTGKQVSDLPQGAKQMTPGGIIFASSGTGGEETPAWACGYPFDDPRDENIYSTVQIGDQCWFAKNLAYLPAVHSNTEFQTQGTNSQPGYGVYGYNGSDINTAKVQTNYSAYGVLYNWFAVDQDSICPTGWHVPSDNEFLILENYLDEGNYTDYCDPIGEPGDCGGGWANAGTYLKASYPDWDGNDSSGFTALPAGYRNTNGSFLVLGSFSFLWSSSVNGSNAWYRDLYSSRSSVYRGNSDLSQANGFSVRCLRTE